MIHINESIIGRKGSTAAGALMPGDVVEYEWRGCKFWRFIPAGYMDDREWEKLGVHPPLHSNLLVSAHFQNKDYHSCDWVDLENDCRVKDLTGSRFGSVYRRRGGWNYEKPEDLRIFVHDLDDSDIIGESIIGKKGNDLHVTYYIEFGGLDPKLLKEYAKGKINFIDLTTGLIGKETTYTDSDSNFNEREILSFAQQIINRKYKFPEMVYARVMDGYKEVIDIFYGRNFSSDLDKYCKAHK